MNENVTAEMKQNRMKEFMTMLPLTLELAGLSKALPGALFTEGQMEVRVTTVRNAFRLAKQLVRDIGDSGA